MLGTLAAGIGLTVAIAYPLIDWTANDKEETSALAKEAIRKGDIEEAEKRINAYINKGKIYERESNKEEIIDVYKLLIDAKIKKAIDTGNYSDAFFDLDEEYLKDEEMYKYRFYPYFYRMRQCLLILKSKGYPTSETHKFIDFYTDQYDIYDEDNGWTKKYVKERLYEYIN